MIEADRPPSDGSPASKPGSFRIATALLVIALIAFGLGVFRANVLVGSLLLASAAGALVVVFIGAGRKKSEGRPMDLDEGVRAFAVWMGNIFLVLISAVIAFFVTCFPIGLLTLMNEANGSPTIAFVVGGLSALGVAAFAAYHLSMLQRAPKAKGREKEGP